MTRTESSSGRTRDACPSVARRAVLTVAAVALRGRLRVLRVVVGGGPGGRVRRRLRRGRRAPALVGRGPGARARRAVPGVRRLPGGGAPALVPGMTTVIRLHHVLT